MRILVLFDLPSCSKREKKAYCKFRAYLLDSGYNMFQFSTYTKVVRGLDSAHKHIAKIEAHVPADGQVVALIITEKQFIGHKILLGCKKTQEKMVGAKQLILI